MKHATQITLVDASRPSRHRQAVCFCCDENYLPFALFAALRLREFHPDADFDIVIANSEPLHVPDSFPEIGLRLVTIKTDGTFRGLNLDQRRTESTYFRLALPAALSDDYDRILYLDSDILFLRDGVSDLLRADLFGLPVAAVRDNCQWRTPRRQAKDLKLFGWSKCPYFNAGVLLIDVAAFRTQGILEKALTFGEKNAAKLARNDQTLLNCILRDNWAEMSPRWNWQFTWASFFFALAEDARVLHFIGPKKPWQSHDGVFPGFISRAFREFLEAHFPDRSPAPMPKSPLQDRRKLLKSLGKHIVSQRKMEAYLARFPDDMILQRPD